MLENSLKKKLKAGNSVFGTWSMLSSPTVLNVIGYAGLDFVIIDLEHGPTSLETLESQLYAAEAAGISPIVRLAEPDAATILRVLELGAQSLIVSHIKSAESAKAVVEATKYPPEGLRGLSPFTRNHGYSDLDLEKKLKATNDQIFTGVLVEGEEGLNQLEEIASTPGLDMVYLGVYDISQSLGFPGQVDHPEVANVVRESVEKITAKGPVAGSVAPNRDYLKFLIDSGMGFVAYRVDSAVLREGFETALGWYHKLVQKT